MGKLTRAPKNLRSLRQAARAGDHSAARTLLRLYGFDELAAGVNRGLPFSPRVKRQVLALTAGTGTGDQPDEWEYRNERAEIVSLLLPDPPSPRRLTRAPQLRTMKMTTLHPEVVAELEAESAARRIKAENASAQGHINALEARLNRVEAACASPAPEHFGDEKFWTEVTAVFRAYVEKQVNEVRADNALLQARIARLEVALAEKTAGQVPWHPQIGRDLQ
jgi:hypothetical protein